MSHLFLGFLLWLFHLPLINFFIYVPILNIFLVCVIAYGAAKRIKDKETGVIFILMLLFVSVPGVSYLFGGMRTSAGIHFAIVRAYEFIAVILMILGLFFYSVENKQAKWLGGLIGGVVVTLNIAYSVYYVFSLVLYTILRAIKTRNYRSHISRLIVAGFVTFFISSVYIVPYFLSVLKHGSDSYQWQWTILSNFDPYLVTLGLGFMGLTFILGIFGIFTLPKSNFKLILI
ncbi:uncharacterized protein METZ01_LOCUS509206, partial [marine metagenome]